MRYFLIAIRAWSHFVSHPTRLAPFRVVKIGFIRSVKRKMNYPKAANRSISYCTPFLAVGG